MGWETVIRGRLSESPARMRPERTLHFKQPTKLFTWSGIKSRYPDHLDHESVAFALTVQSPHYLAFLYLFKFLNFEGLQPNARLTAVDRLD